MIVGVDVDDTVADFTTEWVRRYNIKFHDNITADDVTGWAVENYMKKASRSQLFDILREPDFYEHVSPLRGARGGVYGMLAYGHRVVYVTSCVPGTTEHKRDWLVRWGFLTEQNKFRDFVAAHDKSLVAVNVLFDDRFTTVQSFPRRAILVNTAANALDVWKGQRISGLDSAGWVLDHPDDSPF